MYEYFLEYRTTGHRDDGVGFLCMSISSSTGLLGTEVMGWVSFMKEVYLFLGEGKRDGGRGVSFV